MFRFIDGSKLTALVFLFSFIFIPLAHAKSQNSDPCDEIPGHWKGEIGKQGYYLKAEFEGYKSNENVRLELKVFYPDMMRPYTIIGTCKSGRFVSYSLSGSVEGRYFFLHSNLDDFKAVFYKS